MPYSNSDFALDPQDASAWFKLGILLENASNQQPEALEAYLHGLETDPNNPLCLYMLLLLCERLSDTSQNLFMILDTLQKAHQIVPGNRDLQATFAGVLTLSGNWTEARTLLERLTDGEADFLFTGLFRAVVKSGHIADVLGILKRAGTDERWRPLYEALQAAHAGTPDYLRRVAPEIRTAAISILREIAPQLFGLRRC